MARSTPHSMQSCLGFEQFGPESASVPCTARGREREEQRSGLIRRLEAPWWSAPEDFVCTLPTQSTSASTSR